jgi:hypothetical protein
MANPKKTQDILRSLQETMDTAEYGYKMLVNSKPPERLIGLRNLIVFGRAVTNVLQNLRSTEPDFDVWYEKYKIEMQSDPLMNYFYALRSEILKEGQVKVGVKAYIKEMYLPQDFQRFGPPPPNAKGFFIGDNLGGTGWEVQLPDSSIEKYYVAMPSDIGSVSLKFPNPPRSHMGKEITNNSVQSLSRHYLNYLQQLVKDAKTRFAQK